jgi:hypothetical protein
VSHLWQREETPSARTKPHWGLVSSASGLAFRKASPFVRKAIVVRHGEAKTHRTD